MIAPGNSCSRRRRVVWMPGRSRHAQVEQDHIGLEELRLLQGGGGIVGGAGHVDIAGEFEELAEPLDHNWVVIHQEYGDHGIVLWLATSRFDIRAVRGVVTGPIVR